MTDIQGKVFGDFVPPATTDGSYKGMKKNKEATDNHLQMKLNQELSQINERLKASKIKVRLLITAGTVQLQATLPLKPGDIHKQGKQKKQYKISLAIPANFDGLKTAEEEAQELGKLIARQTFTWTEKYLGVKAIKNKGITFKEFYEQFERRYFETRKRTIKSEGTFAHYEQRYKKYFLLDELITEENLRNEIKKISYPDSRKVAITVARIICKNLSIKANFIDLIIKSEKKQRSIPSDKEIIKNINTFQDYYHNLNDIKKSCVNRWKLYKLIYALLAIYGLRPREIINQPDLDWLISSDNIHNTFKVHSDNKTGYREVFPFVPEWIELFDLKNEENIDYLRQEIAECITSKKLRYKVCIIGRAFRKCGIPFQPYDLRHACAIRAHLQGVAVKAAADNLGHTVEIHTRVYQRWFGFDNRVKAFNQAFEEQNEIEKLKDELTWYKKRVVELEVENTRLKLQNKLP